MPRLDSAIADRIVADYLSGLSTHEVAKRVGRPQSTVLNTLQRLGVPRRRAANVKMFDEVARRQISADYARGESGPRIASRLGVSLPVVMRSLKEFEVSVRGRGLLADEIVFMYDAGMAYKEIGRRLSLSVASVAYWVRRRTTVRSSGERNRTYPIDAAAFDRDSPDGRYFCGLLLADGCASESRGGIAIKLSLAVGDRDLVEKFQSFVKTTRPVSQTGPYWHKGPDGRMIMSQGLASLTIQCQQIAAALGRFGVVPQKSLRERMPDHCLFDPDAWRGMVDGDGSVYLGKSGANYYPRISLCGSETVCHQFAGYIRSVAGKAYAPRRRLSNRSSGPFLWTTEAHGPEAVAVLRAMYGRPGPALRRKEAIAHAMLAADWTRLRDSTLAQARA